jgi:PadR family transcriptional regulator PadR|nr:helix-turn-helix transcriptional regulator [uncultured Oscillibacter sp.]
MSASKGDSKRGMEDNLKRAVTEMLVLNLLDQQDMYASQIMQSLEGGSKGTLTLVSPYMLFYRLIENGYILEAYKKIADDGRRRQYYQITLEGRRYLADLIVVYRRVIGGVELLLGGRGKTSEP